MNDWYSNVMEKCFLIQLYRSESGASAIEYSIIGAVIILVIIASLVSVGEETATLLQTTNRAFSGAE